MSVPRIVPTHDVVLLAATLFHSGHKSDPAVDLLMYLLEHAVDGIASDKTLRELNDVLAAELPAAFVGDFFGLYKDACIMVSLVGSVRTGPRSLRLTIEAAAVGKADALVALDEQLEDPAVRKALEAAGCRVVGLAECATVIGDLLIATVKAGDDLGPERERRGSATSSAAFLEAERVISRSVCRRNSRPGISSAQPDRWRNCSACRGCRTASTTRAGDTWTSAIRMTNRRSIAR